MQNQYIPTQTCRQCGAQLSGEGDSSNHLCENCEASTPAATGPVAYTPTDGLAQTGDEGVQQGFTTVPINVPVDPDNPHWGVGAGFGVWVFSVAALFVFQLAAVIIWLIVERVSGSPLPLSSPEEVSQWALSPSVILVSVIAIIFAHLMTLAVCWAVVTHMGRRPFLQSLGWHWAGLSRFNRFLLVVGTVVGMMVVLFALTKVLPDSDTTPFEQMLKSSHAVRIVIAALAVITAPLVEEAVYRGVLYSALRKRWGIKWAIVIVSLIFPLVHVPQYQGAWASIVGLTILSFALTLIRAWSRSLLPCVVIHMIFNALGALEILRAPWN